MSDFNIEIVPKIKTIKIDNTDKKTAKKKKIKKKKKQKLVKN